MDIMRVITERGMTQAQVAHAIGMHPKTLSNTIAPGRNITVRNLRRIANAIGCNITDFFTDEVREPGTIPCLVKYDEAMTKPIICPHCGRKVKVCVEVDATE